METPPPTFGTALGSAFVDIAPARTPVVPTDRYRVISELGRGGMGIVYRVEDKILGRQIALKRARPNLSPGVRAQLLREAAITALLPHPSIPPLYDSGRDADGLYYTMPILVGQSLTRWLRGPDATLAAGVRIVRTVADAVATAHAVGIVHRDLKPDNVLVGPRGEVWVMDWGVALDPRDPIHGVLGTEGYQSPEQAAGAVVGPATDVFAAGRILQNLLDAVDDDPALRSIADRATASLPQARYDSLDDMAEDLGAWLDNRAVGAHRYSATEAAALFINQYRLPMVIGAIAASILGVVVVASILQQQADYDRVQQALADSLVTQALAEYDTLDLVDAVAAATQANAIAPHPEATGVLLDWHSRNHLARRATTPVPCDGGILKETGIVWCSHERTSALYTTEGELLGSWAEIGTRFLQAHRPGPGPWLGVHDNADVVDLRSGAVLVDKVQPVTYLVGPKIWYTEGFLYELGNPEPIGPSCPDTPSASHVQRQDGQLRLVVICRGGDIQMGPPDALTHLDNEAYSEATIVGDDVWAGGWNGKLYRIPFDDPTNPQVFEPRVGPIRQVVQLGDQVVVRGEQGQTVILDRFGGELTRLDELVSLVAVHNERLWTQIGDQLTEWAPTGALVPHAMDNSGYGGVADISVSHDGTRLLAGHGAGTVTITDLATGDTDTHPGYPGRVSKGLYWTPEDRPRFPRARKDFNGEASNVELAPDGTTTVVADAAARQCEMITGLKLCRGYSDALWPKSERHRGSPVADLIRRGDHIAAVHADGTLWEHYPDRDVQRITLEGTGTAAFSEDRTALLGQDTVTMLGEGDAVLWTYTIADMAPASVALTTSGRVVVGGMGGELLVLQDAKALAYLPGAHSRPLVELLAQGEVVYSASWDGWIRRWDLATLDTM